jgi:hypothetical protein
MLLLLCLMLRLGCITLALHLSLHRAVDSGRLPAQTQLCRTGSGLARSNNDPCPNHDGRVEVNRIEKWRKRWEGPRSPTSNDGSDASTRSDGLDCKSRTYLKGEPESSELGAGVTDGGRSQ